MLGRAGERGCFPQDSPLNAEGLSSLQFPRMLGKFCCIGILLVSKACLVAVVSVLEWPFSKADVVPAAVVRITATFNCTVALYTILLVKHFPASGHLPGCLQLHCFGWVACGCASCRRTLVLCARMMPARLLMQQ